MREMITDVKRLLLFIAVAVGASPASADWTPWQTIQGDAAHSLDISTNTGSLDYGGGAHKVLIRYRNRYTSAFKGVVVLEVHDADGKVRLVNDSLNLKPSAEDSGTASPEIASIVKPTSVRQESEQSQNENQNSIASPPSEIRFPGKWSDWQSVSQGIRLSLRRTIKESQGKFDFELKNDSTRTQSMEYHYAIVGGATMSDSVALPAQSVRSLPGIPSSSITIDSVK
jgi:hypothetical protein